jgi:hypothetical protein
MRQAQPGAQNRKYATAMARRRRCLSAWMPAAKPRRALHDNGGVLAMAGVFAF